jgi:hypothetical protein
MPFPEPGGPLTKITLPAAGNAGAGLAGDGDDELEVDIFFALFFALLLILFDYFMPKTVEDRSALARPASSPLSLQAMRIDAHVQHS